MKPKIIVVLGGMDYGHLFLKYTDDVRACNMLPGEILKSNEVPDLVVFTGGTDVNPLYYAQEKLAFTDRPDKDRDALEALWFSYCRERKIPMTGICRGSQFGCVMNGGALFQHVQNHAIGGYHPVITNEGKLLDVTSTHHQMMDVELTNHELIAWSPEPRSKVYLYDLTALPKGRSPEVEPEVVFFPDTLFLSAQYHPEYMPKDSAGRLFYLETLEDKFPTLLEA
jgi:GMP synthase-like glutamine amidotransferase